MAFNLVLTVSKVLIAPIFSNHRNFETERGKSDTLEIKSLDLFQFDRSVIVVTLFVPQLRRLK